MAFFFQTADGNILLHPSPHSQGIHGVNVRGRLYATDTDESSSNHLAPEGSLDVVNAIKELQRRADSVSARAAHQIRMPCRTVVLACLVRQAGFDVF
jgi:hypothetical protein